MKDKTVYVCPTKQLKHKIKKGKRRLKAKKDIKKISSNRTIVKVNKKKKPFNKAKKNI